MTEALTPPYTEEGEQSVLGALLMDNACWDEVGAILSASDFYAGEHAKVFSAVAALMARGRPADVITVHQECGVELKYLNALAISVPGSKNAKFYAEAVRERAIRRELMRLAHDLAGQAARGGSDKAPVGGLIDQAVSAMLTLQQSGHLTEPRDMRANLDAFIEDLSERADGKVRTFGTRLCDLDRLTAGGGRRGELWVIGARPSMGKSAFVLHLCRAVGQQHQVLLLSQEDSSLMATQRFVSAAGGVNLAHLRNPIGAPESMWTGVTEGVEALQGLQVAMDDQAALTLADVRRKAQQVRRRCGRLDVLVVDYLQLMDDGGENRNLALGRIAYGLQALAKEMGVWVVLLSQLSRKADERSGPPQMSDLRDSGDIEGAAHLIGMLFREHMRKPTEENKHWAQLHVAKQKNGPTDTLNFYFDGALQRFADWEGSVPFRSKAGRA